MQVKLWSQFLVDNMHGNEHLLIDGSPRRIEDAILMESAFDFYKRDKPTLIFIKTSIGESKKRILHRAHIENRKDDLLESDIDSRMKWYQDYVVPSIDFFRNKEKFGFVEIDGEQSIEDVWKQIKEKVFHPVQYRKSYR